MEVVESRNCRCEFDTEKLPLIWIAPLWPAGLIPTLTTGQSIQNRLAQARGIFAIQFTERSTHFGGVAFALPLCDRTLP
jgi:hypothetical protein